MPVQKLLPFVLFLCSQIMRLRSTSHFSCECDHWVICRCQEANVKRPKINLLDHNGTGIFILVEYKCVYILTTVFQTFACLLMACLPIRRPVSPSCPALPHPIKAIRHQRAGAFTAQTYCKTTSWSHACYQQLTHFHHLLTMGAYSMHTNASWPLLRFHYVFVCKWYVCLCCLQTGDKAVDHCLCCVREATWKRPLYTAHCLQVYRCNETATRVRPVQSVFYPSNTLWHFDNLVCIQTNYRIDVIFWIIIFNEHKIAFCLLNGKKLPLSFYHFTYQRLHHQS